MGKRSTKKEREHTKILYKKSNHTIQQSRTCSGTSEFFTKSGFLHIKRKLSQTEHSEGVGTKRDLSVETDVCILRRYYKKKKNRLSLVGSEKSRYSTVGTTEIGTIEEFEPDNSACGDTENTEQNNIQLDITKIMMQNLNHLLNNWVKEYLFENQEAKNKLETALYSITHKAENKTNTSSSRSTYILNREGLSREVKNKKVDASMICNCKYKRNSTDSSCHTAPTSNKNTRIVSTLSIPRNLHKRTDDKDNLKKKIKNKRFVLSVKRSSVVNISSIDLLTISTKSFIKRCTTYDTEEDRKRKRKKRRHIVFLPDASYKSASDYITVDFEENRSTIADSDNFSKINNFDKMPSLVKSLYADDPANITSTDNTNFSVNDNCTMTDFYVPLDQYSSLKLLTKKTHELTNNDADNTVESEPVNFKPNNFGVNEKNQSKSLLTIDNKEMDAKYKYIQKHQNQHVTLRRRRPSKRIKPRRLNKRFTFLYKSVNKERSTVKNFVDHWHNIFEYFAENNDQKNIKLNIDIKVVPTLDTITNDNITQHKVLDGISLNNDVFHLGTNVINKRNKDNKKVLENNPDIVPLLDGASSQAKYIFKSGNSNTGTDNFTTKNDVTNNGIFEDFKELKAIIKELNKAAENILKKKCTKEKEAQCDNKTTNTLENKSKGVQMNKEQIKLPIISGIKLSKIPAKNISEFYNRLMRKSVSYNIIESEAILKVTDMTSAGNVPESEKRLTKSKSLIEMNKNKGFLTYYCNESKKQDYQLHECVCYPPLSKPKGWGKKKTKESGMCDSRYDQDPIRYNECILKCPTSSDDDDDFDRPSMCSNECRKSIGFGEGLVYCVLLWIPVVILFFLLYVYVLKDILYPTDSQSNDLPSNPNKTVYFKLSDLGF